MKSSVDNSLRKETQFQQELRDADKNADKMASKESIYLEKQVWRFGCILPISHIGDFQGKKEIFKKKIFKIRNLRIICILMAFLIFPKFYDILGLTL